MTRRRRGGGAAATQRTTHVTRPPFSIAPAANSEIATMSDLGSGCGISKVVGDVLVERASTAQRSANSPSAALAGRRERADEHAVPPSVFFFGELEFRSSSCRRTRVCGRVAGRLVARREARKVAPPPRMNSRATGGTRRRRRPGRAPPLCDDAAREAPVRPSGARQTTRVLSRVRWSRGGLAPRRSGATRRVGIECELVERGARSRGSDGAGGASARRGPSYTI